MRNLGTLYRFELKKLLQRKMVWAALAILTAVSAFIPASTVIGKIYVSGDATGQGDRWYSLYEIVQRQRSDPAGLDGRTLDTDLIQQAIAQQGILAETTTAYTDGSGNEHSFTVTQRDGSSAGPWTLDGYIMDGQYGDIYNTVVHMVGAENMRPDLTAEDYYAALDARREREHALWGLSDGARAWWDAQAEKIETPLPITGYPDGGWTEIAQSAFVVNVCIFLFAIIALSGLFPMERQRRTEALAMCARNGKTPLYAAKFLAGLTASFAGAVCMTAAMAGTSLVLLGPEDAATAVQQLMNPAYGASMTVRELALTVCGVYLIASLIHAAFVMAVSLVTGGGTSAMAVSFGAMMLFIWVSALPLSHPRLSQLWSLLPTVFGAGGFLSDPRLVRLGGYLTGYQAAPLLWLVMTLALAGLAWALHRRTPDK